MSPLTVAHVIHSLGAGGAEAVLVELAKAAPSAGLRLVIIGLSDARIGGEVDDRAASQLQELGATVVQMHAARYDLSVAVKLARLLRDEHVDIVHTHLKHADVVGGAAARIERLPSVSTLHVIDVPTSRQHRLRVKTAILARRWLSSAVIAVSDPQRQWYMRYAGPSASVTVIPNGVAQVPPTRSRTAIRAELDVPERAMLAMCVSLIRPEKGHADLIEAIRQLPDELPVVVGMAGDGPLFDDIRSTVDSDPLLRQRTRVLGFRRDVADLLAACDFVVHPSLEDALPTALISALAAARPIVATNVGGIPDIVGPDCGVLVPAGRPAELSAGIATMVKTIACQPDKADALRRAARQRYASRFSAPRWAAQLRALYDEVIEARKTARGPAMRRRIALVEFPPSGGLFQFSFQLGEALARAGDEVVLITGPSPELTPREPGCRVRSILPTWHPTGGADVPGWWRRARRAVRAGQLTVAWLILLIYLRFVRPDVVLWSEWRFPIDGWGVQLTRRILPLAVLAQVVHEPRPLVEQPGQDGLYKTSAMMRRALAAAYADLDLAFVLGESAKKALMTTWPITGPVHVIPHGEADVFASDTVSDADCTGPVALSFGTITAYKGLDTLCEAWPLVRKQIPDARLNIVGAVSSDVDESVLRSQFADLPGVTLRTGYVPMRDVPAHFADARCVVLPYKRSSQSGVAHLAHTLRRPIVATRVGDIPAVVRDGVSGLLVTPGDSKALACAMIRLLGNPALARRQGESGARALAAEASWDDVAAKLRAGVDGVTHRA